MSGNPKEHFASQTCHSRWMSEEYEPGLVSVIIPTYNRAHFVTEAMDSVFAQTYRPIELIVVDDGSTDNTGAVLEQWKASHSYDCQFTISYFFQKNQGAPAARNHGAADSNGEFVLFHDSDDLLDTSRIQLQVDAIAGSSSDVCSGSWKTLPSGGHYTCPSSSADPLSDFLEKRIHGGTPVWMLRRRLLRDTGGFDESLLCYQDMDFTFRVLAMRPTVSFEPMAITFIRKHSSSRISQRRSTEDGLRSVLTSHKYRANVLLEQFNEGRYLEPEAHMLVDYAIHACSLRLREVSEGYLSLAATVFPDLRWGRSFMKRTLFCLGGVPLLGLIRRIVRVNLRICEH